MEKLLDRAFKALRTLPETDQERIAWEIIERVQDKTEWDRIIALPQSQKWFEKESKRALRDYKKIANKLSMTFVSVARDNLLREDAYWKNFDDLPAEVRKLAEENYRLWKENPRHPGLRFKKIHATLPVFSFRVGMRHRTVGVETDDGRIAWFWVGSMESFEKLIGPEISAA